MERLNNSCIFWIAITIALSSCEGIVPKTTFDSPFPKRNRDLTNILGERMTIKSGIDTLTLKVYSTTNSNLIINEETGDTIFFGTVCKFRGLYYFNQQLNDTSYWIYAVKLTNNLVYGLNTAWAQTMLIDRAIESGTYQKLVKYISEESIYLHPDKRELRNLFAAIIDSIPLDTILEFQEVTSSSTDITESFAPIDPEDFELFSKVYPNPATNFINIELQQKDKITYLLTDVNDKAVLQGQFTDFRNKIDLRGLADGIYSFTMHSSDNFKETVKIIKTK